MGSNISLLQDITAKVDHLIFSFRCMLSGRRWVSSSSLFSLFIYWKYLNFTFW